MITSGEITDIGTLGKPHGVNGEINLSADVDPASLTCIVIDVDGINVPFFFSSVRSRGRDSYLVKIDGIDSDADVAQLVNKTVWALKSDIDEDTDESDDGFYAEDLVGFRVIDDVSGLRGEITGVDDTTDNVLFVVTADDGKNVLIPVADDFITSVDTDDKTVEMTLPQGLLDL